MGMIHPSPRPRLPCEIHPRVTNCIFQQCKENAAFLKIDPSMIILCGSSAGGNLTAVVAQMARDNNDDGVMAQVLNGPVICHPDHFPKDSKYEYNSWVQNKDSSILSAKTMRKCWEAYYPSAGSDIYASPFLAKSLKGLPAACTCYSISPSLHYIKRGAYISVRVYWLTPLCVTVIQITGLDPLRDEAFAYADRLREDGYIKLNLSSYRVIH